MSCSARKDFNFMDLEQDYEFDDNATFNGADEASVYSSSTMVLGKRTVNHANSAVSIVNSDDMQSTLFDSDEEPENNIDFVAGGDNRDNPLEDDDFICNGVTTRIVKKTFLALTPEQLQLRQECYNKWLFGVLERERERKHIHLQKKRKEEEDKMLLNEEKKRESDDKLQAWHERKAVENQLKLARSQSKTDITTNIKQLEKPSFKFWLNKKNTEAKKSKLKQEQEKKLNETNLQIRRSISKISYEKWNESVLSRSKPVKFPLNRGLETLQGSSIANLNPNPWVNLKE